MSDFENLCKTMRLLEEKKRNTPITATTEVFDELITLYQRAQAETKEYLEKTLGPDPVSSDK